MRETLGFDARELSPGLVARVIFAAAETRSFERATIVLDKVGGAVVSDNTVQRVVGDVGGELAARRDAHAASVLLAPRPEAPPALAVVECDGGRIRMREPGHGRGVHLSGEGWRETKNACLIRATHQSFADDPQPEPPDCFCNAKHVARIAETEALSVAAPPAVRPPGDEAHAEQTDGPASHADWRPKRLVRTVVSSMKRSRDFGRQMASEAKQRRFYEAPAKAFLGDGLPWNWTIWKQHFRAFTPILDFIHPLSYLFLTAKTVHTSSEDVWSQYLTWMRGCWQGEVEQVIEEIELWRRKLGDPPPKAVETDPRKIVARTVHYLRNNRSRMDYPAYRQAGLPVTTAWMESLVKQINYRVKGTEMFWNDPEGAEVILQVRAAALSDDCRLSKHLQTRPGYPFTRPPKPPKAPAEIDKS